MKIKIAHKSAYTESSSFEEVEKDIRAFAGGCTDISYVDTLNVCIDLDELVNIAYQVYSLCRADEGITLNIDKGYSQFITAELGRPWPFARE